MSGASETEAPTDVQERVRRAVERYSSLPAVAIDAGVSPDELYLATPNRLGYALGWIVAAEIVAARFLTCGIDAIPVYHPKHGWDRFLLTRRVSCMGCPDETANRFGMLMLSGNDAPRLVSPSGTARLALGPALKTNSEDAIAQVLSLIPTPSLPEGRHIRCLHHRAARYPSYFGIATEMILEHPGLVVAREIHIDADEISGTYHPLYLHAIPLVPQGPGDRHGMLVAATVYDWFQFQYGDQFAFIDVCGDRGVYRTDRGTWSRTLPPVKDTPLDAVRDRIAAWLNVPSHL